MYVNVVSLFQSIQQEICVCREGGENKGGYSCARLKTSTCLKDAIFYKMTEPCTVDACWQLNVLTTNKKWYVCDVMEMVANTLVVIILQYRNVSNQHVVHFKLIHCYVFLKKRECSRRQKVRKSICPFPMFCSILSSLKQSQSAQEFRGKGHRPSSLHG